MVSQVWCSVLLGCAYGSKLQSGRWSLKRGKSVSLCLITDLIKLTSSDIPRYPGSRSLMVQPKTPVTRYVFDKSDVWATPFFSIFLMGHSDVCLLSILALGDTAFLNFSFPPYIPPLTVSINVFLVFSLFFF